MQIPGSPITLFTLIKRKYHEEDRYHRVRDLDWFVDRYGNPVNQITKKDWIDAIVALVALATLFCGVSG